MPTAPIRPLAATLALVAAAPPPAALDALPALEGLAERWTGLMDLFDTPGMAVAVVHDGRVVAEGFGVRNDDGAPVTPETRFYIASITKTYVAAAVVALAEAGAIDLDAPVRTILPRFELPDDEATATITVRDLLCHRPGIRSSEIVLLDAYTGEITEDRYWHWLARANVAGEVAYSNVHFTLLGRVLESVGGADWREVLERRVLGPAGLHDTTGYASALYGAPNAAVPMERVGGAFRPVAQRKTDRTMHAAGGLGTTALDGARWLALHLQDGTIGGRRVLGAEAARSMREPASTYAEPEGSIRVIDGFGLGWQVGHFNGHRLCQHGGGYVGTFAYMALLPDDDTGVVVLVNGGGPAGALGTIAAVDVMERLTGTTSPWSVHDRYVEMVRARKAEPTAPDEPAGPAHLEVGALSRPVGLYTGAFRNEHLGTLAIVRDGDGLVMRLGDMALDVGPADGTDRFHVLDLSDGDAAATGTFVVEPYGRIERIRIERPGGETIEFAR